MRWERRDRRTEGGTKGGTEGGRELRMKVALLTSNSYNVSSEELFDLFGKFGPIRQIRQGIANNTKGTAFVVYEDVMDAKTACDKLNGFNFQNRYLVGTYTYTKPPPPTFDTVLPAWDGC